ncbi:hypothetical protein PR202_ga19218 [Eleusine coracana subsp. coracana]|uniref:ABC transmembrane type-1 domain-containing protein n=1 Tax=Eleusine coracana subsp. coracana TaxID=191504 RepID=A0AAV5CU20_ELECO|nr:hypothetical protein PR202_ga19218 [Eleusine coracana subsp. coracana]
MQKIRLNGRDEVKKKHAEDGSSPSSSSDHRRLRALRPVMVIKTLQLRDPAAGEASTDTKIKTADQQQSRKNSNAIDSTILQYLQEWMELYSPCFWTSVFALIQLEQKGEGIKLGISYQASRACCLLILATHVLRALFPQLHERTSYCKYSAFVLSEARGKTGIIMTDNSITEPLLNSSIGQQAEAKRPCPYGRASLLELVTFSWMNPVFATGYKKPLEKNEVPDVDGKDSAELLSDSFKKIIDDVERRHGLSTSSIYKAMFLFIRQKAMINAGFAVFSASASYVGPSLINDLVKFLGGERQYGLKRGYILAVAFLSAKVVETIAQRQWIFGARQLGMRLRAALISHIYQKGLRLSCSSRQKHTSGEIINYMSVDIQRITDVIWYTNYIWMLPIQLSLAVYVLHQNLGVGAWAGLAATLAIMACNIPLTRMQKRLQGKIMVAKDNRMKATTEVLRSMKILKLQAWDMQYLQKLQALRREEYNWLWRSVRLSALTTFIFWGSPAFISSITFGSCILMGIPLTAGTVLSALATFRMLQDPIFTLPDLLSVFAQGKVSADRVAKYLQEEELKYDAVTEVPRDNTDYDVEIDHGIFSWELETTSPTLTDVDFKVKRGMKVAICGNGRLWKI